MKGVRVSLDPNVVIVDKDDLQTLNNLFLELAVHDRNGYGPWTRGMRDRVRTALFKLGDWTYG